MERITVRLPEDGAKLLIPDTLTDGTLALLACTKSKTQRSQRACEDQRVQPNANEERAKST